MMFLRADSRACGLIVDHTPAYIAGRYAAMRDFWLAEARKHLGDERTSAAQAARCFHHSYMAELATLQRSVMDMPALITVKPIQRPTYRITNIRDYAKWVEDNQQLLVDYWNLLLTEDGAGPLGEDDFYLFCVCQFDCERDRMEELGRSYGSRSE